MHWNTSTTLKRKSFRNSLHSKIFVEIPKESDHSDNLDAFEGTAESKIIPVHTMAAHGTEGKWCRCTVAFILKLGTRRR
jgi:hypothetical protein